jgi:hypothetical protein
MYFSAEVPTPLGLYTTLVVCVCPPPHLECSPKSPSACTQIWPSNYFHHGAVEMNMYSGLCCQQQKLGVKRANGKPCFIWSIQQPWIQPIASESTTDVPHWQPVLVIPFCFRSFTGNMKHAQSVSNVLINSPMSQKYSPLLVSMIYLCMVACPHHRVVDWCYSWVATPWLFQIWASRCRLVQIICHQSPTRPGQLLQGLCRDVIYDTYVALRAGRCSWVFIYWYRNPHLECFNGCHRTKGGRASEKNVSELDTYNLMWWKMV